MISKVVLMVAAFAVVVHSFTTSHRRDSGFTENDENKGHLTSGWDRHLESNHGRGMRQTGQEQWGGLLVDEGVGKQREDMYGRQGGVGGQRAFGGQGERDQFEEGRYGMRGNNEGYDRIGGSRDSKYISTSHEESNESYEIKKVQKQFHDTDTEYAGNGRKVPNSWKSRSHKSGDHDVQDSQEAVNTIYKGL